MSDNWTPVEDHNPETDGRYLVCAYHPNNPLAPDMFVNGYFAGAWVGMWIVTDWQPLPEFPNRQNEEK